VDRTATSYLNLVDAATAGGLGEGQTYSVDVMDVAIERALANRGALGMYCNSLMVNKAIFDRLPENPPAPLEEIIDGAVKTGADLSRVVAWNYDNSRQILEARTPVPALLHGRLSVDYADRENRPPSPIASQDHWLDRLEAGVRAHIREMEANGATSWSRGPGRRTRSVRQCGERAGGGRPGSKAEPDLCLGAEALAGRGAVGGRRGGRWRITWRTSRRAGGRPSCAGRWSALT
jgi:hypothetical protein